MEQQKTLSLLVFLNLAISVVGSVYLAMFGLSAGITYTLLFCVSTCLLGLIWFFVKGHDILGPIADYIKIPIISNPVLTAVFYIFGQLFAAIVIGIVATSLVSLSIPLYANDFGAQELTFQASEKQLSTPWLIFSVMFAAGNIETYVFNFTAVIVGILLGHLTFNLVFSEEKNAPFRKAFVIIFALILSLSFFTVAHTLNDNYNTAGAFVFAAAFLLISNLSIYLAGFLLAFWMGEHQIHNLVFLIMKHGVQEIFGGFLSVFGVIFLLYEIIIVAYILKNRDKIWPELRAWAQTQFKNF